jgi:hypothetical protein
MGPLSCAGHWGGLFVAIGGMQSYWLQLCWMRPDGSSAVVPAAACIRQSPAQLCGSAEAAVVCAHVPRRGKVFVAIGGVAELLAAAVMDIA